MNNSERERLKKHLKSIILKNKKRGLFYIRAFIGKELQWAALDIPISEVQKFIDYILGGDAQKINNSYRSRSYLEYRLNFYLSNTHYTRLSLKHPEDNLSSAEWPPKHLWWLSSSERKRWKLDLHPRSSSIWDLHSAFSTLVCLTTSWKLTG